MVSISRSSIYSIHSSYISIIISFLVGNSLLGIYSFFIFNSFLLLISFHLLPLLYFLFTFWIYALPFISYLYLSLPLSFYFHSNTFYFYWYFLWINELIFPFLSFIFILSYSYFTYFTFTHIYFISFLLFLSNFFTKLGIYLKCNWRFITNYFHWIWFITDFLFQNFFLFIFIYLFWSFLNIFIYATTGLHGFHVIIGLFLLLSFLYYLFLNYRLSYFLLFSHNFSLERNGLEPVY